MEEWHERIVIVESEIKHAHEKIETLDAKKLSKHEFNGFQQVMDSVKQTFHDSIKTLGDTTSKLGETTVENTKAINSLQTTFATIGEMMPKFLRVIMWLGGIIVTLLLFIGGKLWGLW